MAERSGDWSGRTSQGRGLTQASIWPLAGFSLPTEEGPCPQMQSAHFTLACKAALISN